MSLEVVTFGCRLNAYESEAIKRRAAEAQLRDAVVVNTCAVTAEAVRQSRQAIRRLRRTRPGARIIVTGCAAQTEPQTYAAMPEVDQVLGNAEKLNAESYAGLQMGRAMERVRVNDIMSVRETAAQMIDGFDSHTRAFCRCRMAATIAAASASFPMAGEIPAAWAWAKWWPRPGGWCKKALPKLF